MHLFQASHQWATRPADQRFDTLKELTAVTQSYFKTSQESVVPFESLRTEAVGTDLALVGKQNMPAKLTHFAFGQLSRKLGAPAEYLRSLPATLAAQNLNHAMKQLGNGKPGDANLLFHKNGNLIARAITSDKYNRFWNYEVAQRLENSLQHGWRVAPARPAFPNQPGTRPATEADVLQVSGGSLSIKVGDPIASAGLYASDHDMFAFLINENNRIDDGSEFGLSRGIFVSNSEVGAGALKLTRFLYRYVCGNHIVWDAKDVKEVSVRHIGRYMGGRISNAFYGTMIEYANESAKKEEAQIAAARVKKLGDTKEEVLDYLFGKRIMGRKDLETAYDAAIPAIDGDPRTVYGFVQGATRASQLTQYADERDSMDRAAGKVMQIAF